jgi:putative aminopeptidase FrvX
MMRRSPSCSTVPSRPDLRRALALLALALPAALSAQAPSLHDVLPGWVGLIAAPGRERAATDAILRSGNGWTLGPLGSLVRRAGSGTPRRVIACTLDRPAYAISYIAPDGYLRVHNAEPGRQHPLWDQFHEGQRVLVQGRDGSVHPAVFAVRSTHLWRRRAQQETVATADDLWLDVGARSAADVAALGISLLDPVVRELPTWSYGPAGDPFLAGPAAAQRAGCAAVAAIAQAAPTTGENVYVIATEGSFANAGLTATIARLGKVDEIVLAGARTRGDTAVVTREDAPVGLRGWSLRGSQLSVRSRFGGTLMESVRSSDASAFARAVAAAADVSPDRIRPVAVGAPPSAPAAQVRRDGPTDVADMLARLSDVYGLSGFEAPVRSAVLAELPAWARQRATVDTAGNLILALGPDRDTSVIIAHLDEIGFTVTRVAPDGTLSLATRGGFFPSLWEGQPALLHVGTEPNVTRALGACAAASVGPIRGVFVPRDSAVRKQPAALSAWFGLDSAALVARGVGIGSPITGYKCATRLGGNFFTARSIDDRAGTTALVLGLNGIDPAKLTHKVILVWSVREEVGLEGAAAVAAMFGPSVKRVHAVDTFVSSDSPLEDNRFGFAPLGAGAVVRALDNSSVTPPDEIDRLVALARAQNIPIQVGTTNGGNDGSELVRYGAVNVPIAWPLRYSHSPAEVVDLRDVKALADLVRAVIQAP